MSRTDPTPGERATVTVTCPSCHADPGAWCRASLRPAERLHRARWDDAGVAYEKPWWTTNGRHAAERRKRQVERPVRASLKRKEDTWPGRA